ncbi:hypothetical protein COCNU_01G017860 [Cocos nucifera]|uniref:Uncharacterized protein n=1 Tax=Cocos nucifera TaxID=13894 RepID=A0A8K0MVF5_COCNU|nr:hypothetical protein COCNU_01G017860 [Cocos nucifera]
MMANMFSPSVGSYMGLHIPNQKLAFEDCLIKYLTQSCKLLSWDLAIMEANIMADLQLATTEFAIWGGLSCLCIEYFHNGFPLSLERSSSVHMPACPPLGVALEDGCASETDAQSRKTDGDFRCSNFAGDYFLEKSSPKNAIWDILCNFMFLQRDLFEETEVASDVPDGILQRTESSKSEDWVNIGYA